jgi:hypothetical protein
MCADPQKFLEGYAERVRKLRAAVTELCDYGQENPYSCLPTTMTQLMLAHGFIEPMKAANTFVVAYCATHNVKVPPGFEVPAQQLTEQTGVELRRHDA